MQIEKRTWDLKDAVLGEEKAGRRDRSDQMGRRKTRRVVTLKLKKCPDGHDGCQWKCMLFKVMLLSRGAAVKNGGCRARYRFTEYKARLKFFPYLVLEGHYFGLYSSANSAKISK